MVEEWCGDSGGRLIPLTIVPLWDARARRRRGAPQRRARRARGVLQRDPAARSACRRSTPASGTRSSPRARRPSTVVCMHIGSSSQMPATSADAPVAVAATLSFNNAMASLSDFLFSGVLVQLPDAEARVLRGPDRLAAVRARAGRRRVARAPGVGRREGPRARAAVDLLLPPGLRLLLPRPARARVARARRRRQHHVRDRLPAHRLDVARHEEGRRRHDGSPAGRRGLQDRARQRDPHAVARAVADACVTVARCSGCRRPERCR